MAGTFYFQTVPKHYTLGKAERLKSRKAIDELFSNGQRFTITPFRIFFKVTDSSLQFGVAVGTKNFKKAPDRNRIKRLCREAWRLQKNELGKILKENGQGLHVFLVFTDKELPDYKLVADKINRIIQKLVQSINEKNAANT